MCYFLLTFQKLKENGISSFMSPLAPLSPPSRLTFRAPKINVTYTVNQILSFLSLPTSEQLLQLTQPVIKHFFAHFVPTVDTTLLTLLVALSNSLPPLIASYVIEIIDSSFSPLSLSPTPLSPTPLPLSSPSVSSTTSPLLHDLEYACEGFLYLSYLSTHSPNQTTVFLPVDDPASLELKLCDKIKHWSPPDRLSPLVSFPLTSSNDFSSLFSPSFSPHSPLSPILSLQFYKPHILSILASLEMRERPEKAATTFGESFERFCLSVEILHLSLYAGIAVTPSLPSSLAHFAPSTIYSLLPRAMDTSILSAPMLQDTPLSLWTAFFYPVPLKAVADKLKETIRIYRRVLNAISYSASCYLSSPRLSALADSLQAKVPLFNSLSNHFFFSEDCVAPIPTLGCLYLLTEDILQLTKLLLESNIESSIAVFGPCKVNERNDLKSDSREEKEEEAQKDTNSLLVLGRGLNSISPHYTSPLRRYLLLNERREWRSGALGVTGRSRSVRIDLIAGEKEGKEGESETEDHGAQEKLKFWSALAEDRLRVDDILLTSKIDLFLLRRHAAMKRKCRGPYQREDEKHRATGDSSSEKRGRDEPNDDREGTKEEKVLELRMEEIDTLIISEGREEVGDVWSNKIEIENDRKRRREEREEIIANRRNHLADPEKWEDLYKEERWSVAKPFQEEPLEFFQPVWRGTKLFVKSKGVGKDRKKKRSYRKKCGDFIDTGRQSSITTERGNREIEDQSFVFSCEAERAREEKEFWFWSLATAPLSTTSTLPSSSSSTSSPSQRYKALMNDSLEWNKWRNRYLIIESLMLTEMKSPMLRRYKALLSGTSVYHDLRWKHHLTAGYLGSLLSKVAIQIPEKLRNKESHSRRIAKVREEEKDEFYEELEELLKGTWRAPMEGSDYDLEEYFNEEFEEEIAEKEEENRILEEKSSGGRAQDPFLIQEFLTEMNILFQREARLRQVRKIGTHYSLWDTHHHFIVSFLEFLLLKSYEKFIQSEMPDALDKIILYHRPTPQNALLPLDHVSKRRTPKEIGERGDIEAGELREDDAHLLNVKVDVSVNKQERFTWIVELLRPYFKVLIKKVLGKKVIRLILEDKERSRAATRVANNKDSYKAYYDRSGYAVKKHYGSKKKPLMIKNMKSQPTKTEAGCIKKQEEDI